MAVVDAERGLVYRFPRPADNQYRYALAYHLNGLGSGAYNREDFHRAAELFRRAAGVTPPYYLYPHINLIGALALTGQRQQALAHLRTACDIDPSYTRYAMLAEQDFASMNSMVQSRL